MATQRAQPACHDGARPGSHDLGEHLLGGLARPLRVQPGMTVTLHTQVENLANLLAARRRQALTRGRRDQAYRRLVAEALDVSIDAVGVCPPARRPIPFSPDNALESSHSRAA